MIINANAQKYRQGSLDIAEFKRTEFDYATNIPCNIINTLPEEEIDTIINTVIDRYYEVGFPYYEIDDKKTVREFGYLLGFDASTLELPDNALQQNMIGLGLCNAFHPDMWNIKCRNAKTPMEIFSDRDLFYRALRRRIKYSDTKLAPFNIRKSLKVFSGAQGVSNFRPTVAKWVYQKFCPLGGSVLDPCMGYGGRLLGFLSSHAQEYVGVDPSRETVKSNERMLKNIKRVSSIDKSVELIELPFEDYWTDRRFDVVFTSPPYFNVEKYSDNNGTQSYLRYSNYGLWVESFLKPLLVNSYNFLRDGGYLAINVGSPITDDSINIGTAIFGYSPVIYNMRLSKMFGTGAKKTISHKVEPLLVWTKNQTVHWNEIARKRLSAVQPVLGCVN